MNPSDVWATSPIRPPERVTGASSAAVRSWSGANHRWLVASRSFRQLQQAGSVRVIGPSRLARAFPGWFGPNPFARTIAATAQAVRASA